MTIEQFEQKIEILNGKGEWFRVVYHSLYKEKSIKIVTKKDEFVCAGETFDEAFNHVLDLMLLRCKEKTFKKDYKILKGTK